MRNTVGEAFLFNFERKSSSCRIGAAVKTEDGFLAVAGFVGIMPAVVGDRMIAAAEKAGVSVVDLGDDTQREVTAVVWGDLDPKALIDLIVLGIAESATKAFLVEAIDSGLIIPDDDLFNFLRG